MKLIKKNQDILAIIIAGLLLRVFLSFFGTLWIDFNTFVAWSVRLTEVDFSLFYQVWSDYLPGYFYVLWLLGKIHTSFPLIPTTLIYKMPAILADIATAWFIFKVLKQFKKGKIALVTASLYLFNPAVFANSSLWGQVDSLTSLFSILVLYFVNSNFILSSVFLAIGTLIKPQAALAALVVVFIMLRDKWEIKKIFAYVLLGGLIFTAAFLPFNSGKPIFVFIHERILVTLNQYPYSSVNAFNFWGLFGFWKSDIGSTISPGLIGVLVTLMAGFYTAKKVIKKKGGEYFLMAVLFAANFLFFSRMHERHFLPTLAPLAISMGLIPELIIPYFAFSISYIANLYFAFIWITKDFKYVFSDFVIDLIIGINLGNFILLINRVVRKKTWEIGFGKLFQIIKKGEVFKKDTKAEKLPSIRIKPEYLRLALIGLIAFSLISRLLFLWSPENEYFDEVYHVFTAKVMKANDPKAWEWWNPHPEGYAYEWTHPPLAKLGIWLGMSIFGENAFAWRLPGALLGVGSVILVYLIAKHFFKDQLLALLAGLVFALDGLPLVMSRIGMNDSYLLFFILLAYYFYLKEKLFLSAVSFGLALASKWSAIWAVPIFVVTHFVFKRKIKPSYLLFLVLPPLIYLATYIPMFLTGHGFDIFIGMQKQMWWYHTQLDATHPYTSLWYTWPILIRPIWLYTGNQGELIKNIYAMGNPLIFWTGILAIITCSYWAIKKRSKILGLVIFSYLIFFMPWAASPRIMFLYHYLPSIPFMAIAIALLLRRYPKYIPYYLLLAICLFIYFYPHLTAIPVSQSLNDSYYWFQSWR